MKFRLLSLSTFMLLTVHANTAAAQTYTDVTIGSAHICAITDSSDVECTTAQHAQRYDAPEGLAQLIDVAAGDQHTCGIDLDGQAICWGDKQSEFGAFGELAIPEITQPLVSIAAGTNHTCAVDVNGRAWCWGLNTNEQTQVPGNGFGTNGDGFIKVDAGRNFSCGIQKDENIACWTNDTHLARSRFVEGPFIDLDVSYRNACGIKRDGSIHCWQSRMAPPENGPYTDLVVSSSAICGLNQNQTVDCTFAPGLAINSPIFPADARFTSIESGANVFYEALPFCGLTVSGSIECSTSNQFAGLNPPGRDDLFDQNLRDVHFALSARRYARNKIELFWNNPPARYGLDQILVEVYRNDVLVDTTPNSTSWYDPSEQSQRLVVYKIRATDGRGRLGPFSATATVDNETGSVTYDNLPNSFDIVTPTNTVDSLRISYSGNGYLVLWSGSEVGTNGLKGYELRVNNEPVVFTDGFYHRLDNINRSDCNLISVAAMSDQGTIFDYRTIVTNRFSRNYSSCRSR